MSFDFRLLAETVDFMNKRRKTRRFRSKIAANKRTHFEFNVVVYVVRANNCRHHFAKRLVVVALKFSIAAELRRMKLNSNLRINYEK